MNNTACDLIQLLFSVSFAGSISFLTISVGYYLVSTYIKMNWFYYLLKSVLLFFLIPAFAICMIALPNVREIAVIGTDFTTVQLITINTFSTVLNKNIKNSPLFDYLLIVWLAGFFIIYLYKIIKDINILKKLLLLSKLNHIPALENEKLQIMQKLKITKSIPIYINNIVSVPFISGVFHPKIYIPEAELNNSSLSSIIEHELVHYKNHDLVYRNLAALIKGLHWYNPIVYIFVDYFNQNCEIACDEIVLKGKSRTECKEYAETIINDICTPTNWAGTIGFSSDVKRIKRRLYYIMKKDIKPRKIAILMLSVFTALLCPLTVYAVSIGSSVLQEKISEGTKSYDLESYSFDGTYIEQKETNVDTKFITIEIPLTRGANLIDCDLAGTSQIIVDSLNLSKDSKVQFIIAASDKNSSYKAGIIDNQNNVRYLNSSSGTISYTFTINTTGSYKFFIQGASTANIHVSGSITIS